METELQKVEQKPEAEDPNSINAAPAGATLDIAEEKNDNKVQDESAKPQEYILYKRRWV